MKLIAGPMTDQMAWDRIYELALTVAQQHGAVIPDAAKVVGPYAFHQEVRLSVSGVTLDWNGRKP